MARRAFSSSHRRFNPLTREWVLVSPQRLDRPWLGRTEPMAATPALSYDPGCYLCPGNARAGSARNPAYERTFVFENDFPALRSDAGEESSDPSTSSGSSRADSRDDEGSLLVAQAESGICRVVCFSPRHDRSLASLSADDVKSVVDVWVDEVEALGAKPWVNYVQIFENRGAAMGASNPHPHCQVWANATVPDIPRQEQDAQAAHLASRGACLLCDYLALERARAERVVVANEVFTALVPFWAVWPYEMLVLPNRHVAALDDLSTNERALLADIVKQVVTRYDGLFNASCPYSMGFHQRPTDGATHDEWHLHAHYYPPVLRSAAVHKFMVGYELLATPQRDLTPELAAAALRDQRLLVECSD